MAGKRLTEADAEQVWGQLEAAGYDVAESAKQQGVALSTIYYRLRAVGISFEEINQRRYNNPRDVAPSIGRDGMVTMSIADYAILKNQALFGEWCRTQDPIRTIETLTRMLESIGATMTLGGEPDACSDQP